MHQTDLPKGDLYKTETLIKYQPSNARSGSSRQLLNAPHVYLTSR